MGLSIKGIRITSLSVARNDEGKDVITADYQLVASNDKVLAKESLTTATSYGSTPFQPSPATIKALTDGVALYRKDVEMSLGFDAA